MVLLRVVIDAQIFHHFSPTTLKESKYFPILLQIKKGVILIVTGGSKYNIECKKGPHEFLTLLAQLKTAGKLDSLENETVDGYQKLIENKAKLLGISSKFNDSHIVALAIAGKADIIITEDSASHKFIRDKRLYKEFSANPPFIYCKRSHEKDLIKKMHIASKRYNKNIKKKRV